jgi:hypothetical protein
MPSDWMRRLRSDSDKGSSPVFHRDRSMHSSFALGIGRERLTRSVEPKEVLDG